MPAGGAGWPAARDRRQPASTPPTPSSPPAPGAGAGAGAGAGLTHVPEPRIDAGRYAARQEGAAPTRGRRAGTAKGARWRAPRRCAPPSPTHPTPAAARYGRARLRAARYSDRRICHRPAPERLLVFHALQKSGFWGLFHPALQRKLSPVQDENAVVGTRRRCHLDRLVVIPDVVCAAHLRLVPGHRADAPGTSPPGLAAPHDLPGRRISKLRGLRPYIDFLAWGFASRCRRWQCCASYS